jgi:hypothetical protein
VTVGTGSGEEPNDLVTLLGGLEEAGGALVTGLTAGLAAGGGGLGRATGSGRRIGRRRARGVLGVLVEAGLELSLTRVELGERRAQLGHLGFEGRKRGELGFQLGHSGLERPTAWALGVGRAHTPGVRGADPGFLPT